MSDPIFKRIYNLIYPVGSIYKSTSSTSPAILFGGTWTQIYNDFDYIYTGSQVIYPSWYSESQTGKVALRGAYGEGLFEGVFVSRDTPPGYTKKVGCTAQFFTNSSNFGQVYLNSRLMCEGRTWSGDTFRIVPPSNLYTIDEIGKETTLGYSNPGVNLYVRNTESHACEIRDITVHGYFISTFKKYVWRRTA